MMGMRMASTTVLGAVLLLAAAGGPAGAKKQEAPAGGPSAQNISKEARAPLNAVQEALKTNDLATAQAKLAEAKAAMKTDDDKYFVGQFGYQIATKSNDNAATAEAIDLMIQSNKAPADQLPTLYVAGGQVAFQTNNFAKADQYLTQALTLKASDPQLAGLLFEAKMREGKGAEAIAELQRDITAQRAAGQKPPSNWYGRGISEGYKAKLAQPTFELSYLWLQDYPSLDNWRDSLTIFRQLTKIDPDTNLDVMRFMRALGALKGQGDYVEYADAVYLRYPNEAKSLLDEGVKAGQVNITQGNAKEDYAAAAKRIAADKASLDKSPTGTGAQALSTADAFASYGENAKAAEDYRLALQKGGVDPALVNTRLALVLAKQGQKDAAKQALATVTTGPRAVLARYMTIWLNQPA